MLNPTQIHPDVVETLLGLEISDKPVDTARVLPPKAYTSDPFFQFEQEAVFMHSWLCVGRTQQLPNVGDFISLTLVGEPILVVRDSDRSIKAMSALCRHRGVPMALNCQGNTKHFVCPYHRWTYSLAGELIGAPHMAKTIAMEDLKRESELPQLKVEIWQGFIFVNFDPESESLAPTLTKYDPYLENYDLDTMITIEPQFPSEPIPWNWKMLIENYMEPYHTDFVHPILHDFAPTTKAEFDPWQDGDNAITRRAPLLAKDGGMSLDGWAASPELPIISGLNDKQRSQIGFTLLPPTMVICFTPSMMTYGLIYPLSSTRVMAGGGLLSAGGMCVPKSTAALPDFDERLARTVEGSRKIGEQDTSINLAMQATKYSRFSPRGRFCYLEEPLSQFNRWLTAKYRAQAIRMGMTHFESVGESQPVESQSVENQSGKSKQISEASAPTAIAS